MPLDRTAVGRRAEPFLRSWTETDVLLYALSVGAGQRDPQQELELTTENSQGRPLRVIPTFAILLTQTGLAKRIPFGSYQPSALLHAEQSLVVHRPLPVAGTMRVEAQLLDIQDKRSGALVRIAATGFDASTGEQLATTTLGYFIRGEGGFGAAPATRADVSWQLPDRPPDREITSPTRPDQALLYRLNGDHNPLHSDPRFAAQAGFSRPILHGLCTYGVVCRELLHVYCDTDPARFGSFSARFSRPVYPGDTLTTRLWVGPDQVLFQATSGDGQVVLDRGVWTGPTGAPSG